VVDPYREIGGNEACRRLAAAFYARVARDPVLRPLFPGKSFRCAIEEFTAFLAQVLGGPGEDSQFRWWLSLRESHLRFKIGPRERAAWMRLMNLALDDAQIEEPLRRDLLRFFQQSSAYVVNQDEKHAAADTAAPPSAELSRRWDAQVGLDQAAAAIRSGDAGRAIAIAEGPAGQVWTPSVHTGVMAAMIRRGTEEMLDYVTKRLHGQPALARERFAGRTLLHDAAAVGCLPIVEGLLSLGADPDGCDSGQHTPLYSVGNECSPERASEAARLLVHAGADVNARDGAKRCTALHMAARRGNVAAAAAFLELGADIDPADILGETPLRRAVNCNKVEVARLLIDKGADPRSRGSKGLTPIQAAKSAAMKAVFLPYR
jgi:truncated hemoglobin YjbI